MAAPQCPQPCLKACLTILARRITAERRVREDQRRDAAGVAAIKFLREHAAPRLAEKMGLRDAQPVEEAREGVRILRHRPVMRRIG